MLKASLPNEWSYELSEEVVKDYVQRNFVGKRMHADWAIHNSKNDKGQRNLHIHVLLTIVATAGIFNRISVSPLKNTCIIFPRIESSVTTSPPELDVTGITAG